MESGHKKESMFAFQCYKHCRISVSRRVNSLTVVGTAEREAGFRCPMATCEPGQWVFLPFLSLQTRFWRHPSRSPSPCFIAAHFRVVSGRLHWPKSSNAAKFLEMKVTKRLYFDKVLLLKSITSVGNVILLLCLSVWYKTISGVLLLWCMFACAHRGLNVLSNDARWQNVPFYKCCYSYVGFNLLSLKMKVRLVSSPVCLSCLSVCLSPPNKFWTN
jgi:hypothetical protein